MKTKEFKIVWEIDIEAETPLEAARLARKMIASKPKWQFIVQDDKTNDIFSVDFAEKLGEQVTLKNGSYKPIITL
jgi:hypothetical protein